MSFLRKIFRIPLFLLWFIICPLICRIVNHGKKSSLQALTWTLRWAKVTSKILGLKINVYGDPAGFEGGLIAANHQSCVDILVLASVFKIRFAPKAEMRKWPIIGFMTQCNDPVWIDRSTPNKAKFSAEAMSNTMKAGLAMMVFPEGTVSDGKNGLLPFKSTAFQSVIDSGRKVLPVIISYDQICRSKVQWTENMSFLSHVWLILGLKKIDVAVYIMEGIEVLPGEDRKLLAARVYSVMDEMWRSL